MQSGHKADEKFNFGVMNDKLGQGYIPLMNLLIRERQGVTFKAFSK